MPTTAASRAAPRSSGRSRRTARWCDALQERFTVRFFRFSSSAARAAGPAGLTFTGTRTELAPSLSGARDELAGVPLSGLIVATDGADTAETGLTGTLRALKAASVPVFTVGFGRERFGKDVQLGRVQAPARVLKDASLSIDVVVSQSGYAGETVPVQIEDDGRIVGTEDVRLPADGEPATVRVPWTASEAGPRVLRFRIPPQPGEMVTENNARDVLVDVEDRSERILYIEGEPRYEMKFVRRAVADDKNLHVVVLQRTAENKFLRLGVENAQELVEGFPATRDELFAYRGLILGSIPASFFTPDQLRMMADFVNVRGGGLLALGGRHAFAEGGYVDTPVADVLPVVLEPDPEAPFFAEVKVHPTRAGATHPATQIAATEQASADRWASLPPLTSVNQLRRVKPGATVLLTGDTDAGRDAQVVLAYQRYGAGKALALGVQDTWLWQMHHDIAVDDLTHELLWRRLLRWLVDGVPDRVMASASRGRVEPGEAVTVAAEVQGQVVPRREQQPGDRHARRPHRPGDDRAHGVGGRPRRSVSGALHALRAGPLRGDGVGGARRRDARRRPRVLPRGAGRRRVLRRGHARAAPPTRGRGDRRAVLHGGRRERPRQGRAVRRRRRDGRGPAGSVGHAGPAAALPRARRERMGVAAEAGMGVRRALAAGVLAILLAAPAAAQQSRLLVVVGLGGDPEMAAAFHDWAATLVDAATTTYRLPASSVVYLDEQPERDPARITGKSTRENVEAAVKRIAAASAPGDRVFIVLIGHGSDDRGTAAVQPARAGPDGRRLRAAARRAEGAGGRRS